MGDGIFSKSETLPKNFTVINLELLGGKNENKPSQSFFAVNYRKNYFIIKSVDSNTGVSIQQNLFDQVFEMFFTYKFPM